MEVSIWNISINRYNKKIPIMGIESIIVKLFFVEEGQRYNKKIPIMGIESRPASPSSHPPPRSPRQIQ
jgi:hypothetical protein